MQVLPFMLKDIFYCPHEEINSQFFWNVWHFWKRRLMKIVLAFNYMGASLSTESSLGKKLAWIYCLWFRRFKCYFDYIHKWVFVSTIPKWLGRKWSLLLAIWQEKWSKNQYIASICYGRTASWMAWK
jgi:hypothetical protein